jgi:lipoprotein NlpD
MEKRQPERLGFSSRPIIILIVCGVVAGCAAPPPAQISDRDQPPTRRLDGGQGGTSSAARPAAQQVPIPRSAEHQVNRGETLYSIAWRYGLDYRTLARHNGIAPPYTIYPSQRLRLDVGQRPAPAPAAVPSVASTPPPATVARSENRTPEPAQPARVATPAGAVDWRWPAPGRILVPFNGNNGLNKGIDIDGNLGQPVLAAAAGEVVYAGSGLRGYGKLLIIKHNQNYLSAYAHNQHLLVQEGDVVKVGQRVADMGSSGTDRVKLHFEIRRDGTPVDPMRYLPRR